MGLGRKLVLLTVGFFTTLYLLGILTQLNFGLLAPIIAFTIGPLVPIIVHYMSRAPNRQRVLPTGITLARFLGMLQVVALIAILYSPSALRIPLGNANITANLPDSSLSIQPFVKYLESKYRVVIANNSQMLQDDLSISGHKAYFLIGPDTGEPLNVDDSARVSYAYHNDNVSLFIAEGNETNNEFLGNTFSVIVHGYPIIDNESPFIDRQVFPVTVNLDTGPVRGVIDTAGPIYTLGNYQIPGTPITQSSSHMTHVGLTSPESTEGSTGSSTRGLWNSTLGRRSVVDVEKLTNSRALLISDSSPFSRLYNYTFPSLSINETVFANSLANWVTEGDMQTTIILDNYHYVGISESASTDVSANLPVGRLFATGLTIFLSTADNSYDMFLQDSRPFIIGLALFTTWGLYSGLVRKYANEKRGKDDQRVPIVERMIVAESEYRRQFLNIVRDKQFYVAGLQQLHEVLDNLVVREFGTPMKNLSVQQLTIRLGPELGVQTRQLFDELEKISRYAKGETRFIFPPVLTGWKRHTSKLTMETEQFLNQLGLTITGRDIKKKGLDYKTRGL